MTPLAAVQAAAHNLVWPSMHPRRRARAAPPMRGASGTYAHCAYHPRCPAHSSHRHGRKATVASTIRRAGAGRGRCARAQSAGPTRGVPHIPAPSLSSCSRWRAPSAQAVQRTARACRCAPSREGAHRASGAL
eukprot:scaffold168580_cov30-Tisochrysis_lutea.AAC.1